MTELGYFLASEEHGPERVVENAARAEQAGFEHLMLSDHYHPWTPQQGHSPFAWTVIGAISRATERATVCTGVTCPTIRIHPAIIAQAAATAGCLLPGRFILGLGAGENLNEHITGEKWPAPDVRLEMLEEGVSVIRDLWEGGERSHHGRYYTVEDARVYDLPEALPPIFLAAGGKQAAELAGRIADGIIATAPKPEMLDAFREAGGSGKPRFAKLTVCWGENEDEARRAAFEAWPTAPLPDITAELRTPSDFEQTVKALVSEEQVAKEITCGPDPQRHLQAIQKYADAGYDRIYVHQVGADQDGFLRFYEREVVPHFTRRPAPAGTW